MDMQEKIWLKNYPPAVPAEIDLSASASYTSLVTLMEEAMRKFADRPAFQMLEEELSYQQWREASYQFAGYLQTLGMKKGERIALMMPNIFQYPISVMGAHLAGCIVVNCNPLYSARELAFQLKDSGATAIVIVENFAHTLAEVIHDTAVRHVVVVAVGDMLPFVKGLAVNVVLRYIKKAVPAWHLPQAVRWQNALQYGARAGFRKVDINAEDLAFLQYTGGTTGTAKGAQLSHRNIVANVLQAGAWIAPAMKNDQEVMITALPLYHIFALTANFFAMMHFGAKSLLILNPRDCEAMVKTLSQQHWTLITGVNTLFNMLLNHPKFSSIDFSQVTMALGGGMAVQAGVAERWQQCTGTPICQAYGLSETSPAVTMNRTDDDYNGAIGYPLPSTQVSIRDEQGKILPHGEIGELCVLGPQVTRGYWQREDENRRSFWQDGAFRTGDLGYINPQGLVFIVDRLKDMIIVSGFKVFPNEVEEVISAYPKVLECCVVGVADGKTGEAVKAFIVRKDLTLTAEEIIAYCHEKLTNYKVPKFISFIDSLPKTNVGKILRKNLRETPPAS